MVFDGNESPLQKRSRPKLNLTPAVRDLYEKNRGTGVPDSSAWHTVVNGRIPTERLAFGPLTAKRPIDYRVVARFIRTYCPQNMAFYLDTNFFTGEEKPDVLWHALLEKQIVITPLVWRELQPWLGTPFRNRSIRDLLLDARLYKNPNIEFSPDKEWHPFHSVAHAYYVNLLAVRKRMGKALVDQFAADHGREPTKQEIDRMIQTAGTERDFHLLRKGRESFGTPTFFTDEELVAYAVLGGLIRGKEVTILGTDTDVHEQFVKLVSLLDWHYQALLSAERYAADSSAFECRKLIRTTDELRYYFADDEGILARKPVDNPNDFVRWLLPREYTSNPVYCLLFGGNGSELRFTPMTYNAERDMVRVLEMKGKTGGANTDLINGMNCHVTGFPRGIDDPRKFVILVRDHTEDKEPLRFPLLDIAHAGCLPQKTS